MLVGGLVGVGELDQLDLLELVLADHAADVLAVAAGFGAEAGGVGAEAGGELRFVEDLVAEEVGDGDLGGGNHPKITAVQQFSALDKFLQVIAIYVLLNDDSVFLNF